MLLLIKISEKTSTSKMDLKSIILKEQLQLSRLQYQPMLLLYTMIKF